MKTLSQLRLFSSSLVYDVTHFSLIALLADFICNVTVAVPLLRKALATPLALVRFPFDVQKRMVEPIAKLEEAMAALFADQ